MPRIASFQNVARREEIKKEQERVVLATKLIGTFFFSTLKKSK